MPPELMALGPMIKRPQHGVNGHKAAEPLKGGKPMKQTDGVSLEQGYKKLAEPGMGGRAVTPNKG